MSEQSARGGFNSKLKVGKKKITKVKKSNKDLSLEDMIRRIKQNKIIKRS